MLATIIKHYWKLILIFTVVGASASFGLSLAQKPVYVAESRLLIRYIQTSGVDAYAASRAAGKIAQIFAEISKTELFLEKVLESQYGQDLPVPPQSDLIARKEFWEKTIDVSTGIDSSMVRVRAYSDNAVDPKRYVEAVSYVLLTSGEEFHGANGLVSVKLVDGPVSFKKSILSSVIVYGISGMFLGALIGLMLSGLLFAVQSMSKLSEADRTVVVASNQISQRAQQQLPDQQYVSELQTAPGVKVSSAIPTVEQIIKTAPNVSQVVQNESLTQSLNHQQTQTREFQLTKPTGSVVRTVFDDLNRLGLDPAKLSVEA